MPARSACAARSSARRRCSPSGGVESILITSPVVSAPAIERLVALNGRVAGSHGRRRQSRERRCARRRTSRAAAQGHHRYRSGNPAHGRRLGRSRGRAAEGDPLERQAFLPRSADVLRHSAAHQGLQGTLRGDRGAYGVPAHDRRGAGRERRSVARSSPVRAPERITSTRSSACSRNGRSAPMCSWIGSTRSAIWPTTRRRRSSTRCSSTRA